ncbi:SPOR domain-containing protein [Adhaeribacter rhizoryzae]|uniref:SPOR domain-containing protein n=1 Tax=Adhaeribacter rhizoryzae TaxID=2607907 RepID=A0A5M6DPJ7_9BACT|nr:SPOR domain-containing protein [Adhaeribacter rhizoryzae]KAA5549427.1 SPOR domain-containing protein [Adhaeribacter rhizoryzae]
MKKNFFSSVLVLLFLFFMSACATAVRTTGSTDARIEGTAKAEDLSKYRPKFDLPAGATGTNTGSTAAATAIPTNHVNTKVAALMDTLANMNKSIRFAQGYRILAYTGMERKTALDLRAEIVARLPDEPVYPQYKQPTWRVKVGDYFSRIEAQQVLLRIKDLAPNAMIVVDQINVK